VPSSSSTWAIPRGPAGPCSSSLPWQPSDTRSRT
jgi:hypothetical protein